MKNADLENKMYRDWVTLGQSQRETLTNQHGYSPLEAARCVMYNVSAISHELAYQIESLERNEAARQRVLNPPESRSR